jgi:hypothetical protein
MKRTLIIIILPFLQIISIYSQEGTGVIKGRVYNSGTNEGVAFATAQVWETTNGTVTDENGDFTLSGIKPGFIELRVSSIGFKTYISSAIMVTPSNHVNLEIPLRNLTSVLERLWSDLHPLQRRLKHLYR